MVAKYNQTVKKLSIQTGLARHLFDVESNARLNGWNKEYEQQYNHIYALYQIKHKLRKLQMGQVKWSPKLQQYCKEIDLWSMMFKKRKGLKISNKRIRRFAKKTGIQEVHMNSLLQVSNKLDKAFKDYKAAKENAGVWQDDFLESLAKACAEANDAYVEVELKKLKQVLNQKRMARNAKCMREKLGQNATTQLYVMENDNRQLVTNKKDTEKACCEENDHCFSQSESMPHKGDCLSPTYSVCLLYGTTNWGATA